MKCSTTLFLGNQNFWRCKGMKLLVYIQELNRKYTANFLIMIYFNNVSIRKQNFLQKIVCHFTPKRLPFEAQTQRNRASNIMRSRPDWNVKNHLLPTVLIQRQLDGYRKAGDAHASPALFLRVG